MFRRQNSPAPARSPLSAPDRRGPAGQIGQQLAPAIAAVKTPTNSPVINIVSRRSGVALASFQTSTGSAPPRCPRCLPGSPSRSAPNSRAPTPALRSGSPAQNPGRRPAGRSSPRRASNRPVPQGAGRLDDQQAAGLSWQAQRGGLASRWTARRISSATNVAVCAGKAAGGAAPAGVAGGAGGGRSTAAGAGALDRPESATGKSNKRRTKQTGRPPAALTGTQEEWGGNEQQDQQGDLGRRVQVRAIPALTQVAEALPDRLEDRLLAGCRRRPDGRPKKPAGRAPRWSYASPRVVRRHGAEPLRSGRLRQSGQHFARRPNPLRQVLFSGSGDLHRGRARAAWRRRASRSGASSTFRRSVAFERHAAGEHFVKITPNA